MKIGVLDSGIGGTTVLEEIKKLLPNEEYIYFGDSENCPYGTKPLPILREIVSRAVEKLLNQGAKIIVLACNTATTQTIDYLREKYPEVPFVGTEPAVKKACDESPEDAKILLLATEGTAKAERTHELIQKNRKPDQEVVVVACEGLARAIEDKNDAEITKILEKVSEISSALQKTEKQGLAEFSAVILGCTHYPLIRDRIQAKFPRAKLVDGGEGVAREVAKIVRTL